MTYDARQPDFDVVAYLRSFAAEPKAEDLIEVHRRVLAAIALRNEVQRRKRWWMVGAAAATAAALTIAVATWPVQSARQPVATAAQNLALPVLQPARTLTFSLQPVTHRSTHRQTTAASGLRSVALIEARGDDKASFMKLTTADPNVVILLQGEERTEINE